MRPITICLINQKGGCGKSSTCFHLAGHYAQTGKRVLLIDADPQGSLGQGFFGSSFVECLEPHETLAAVFQERAFLMSEFLLANAPLDNIIVVRSNQHLAVHNAPCPETAGLQQFALQAWLDQLEGFGGDPGRGATPRSEQRPALLRWESGVWSLEARRKEDRRPVGDRMTTNHTNDMKVSTGREVS